MLLPQSHILAPRANAARRSPTSNRLILSVLLNCILFLALLGAFVFTNHRDLSTTDALRKISLYSPVFDRVDLRVSTQKLNGELWDGGDLPWYGGLDEEEKEAQWNDLEFIRMIPVTSADLLKIGKDPAKVAKFEDSYWHMGNDSYVATLDIFHQVHCLNLIRQAAMGACPNKDLPTPNKGKIETSHLKHCTNMLMQHLLCTGDTGVLTYNWIHENNYPFPDFGVNRKCKDWKQLIEYRDRYSVEDALYRNYTKQSVNIIV